jgi:hypothetical protein
LVTKIGNTVSGVTASVVDGKLNLFSTTDDIVTYGTAIEKVGLSPRTYVKTAIGDQSLTFTELATLPAPRFSLPKWSGFGFSGSHNVRAVTYDFNDDRVPDVLIFSRPAQTGGQWPNYSEIQFLKNNGSGSFSDVTDSTLIGYDTKTAVTYNPKFLDINGDGLEDILVSGQDFTGKNTSTQFLLKTTDKKYVAAYQNILSDFSAQTTSMAGTDNSGNTVNLIRGPNGKLYLVSAVSYMNGADRQLGIYLSDLGAQGVTSAQSSLAAIKAAWPYMTDAQANAVLAKTAATYFGYRVIDDATVMSPYGGLAMPMAGGKMNTLSGGISGVGYDGGGAVAMDSLGRSYNIKLNSMVQNGMNQFGFNTEHIDQYTLTSHTEYLINGSVNTYNGMRIGYEDRNRWNTVSGDPSTGAMLAGGLPRQFTFGIPSYYKNGNLNIGSQYSSLNSNPFLGMSGAWGAVNQSGVLDNVVSYIHPNGFSAQASLMHVGTNIRPGLVTNVSPIIGTWAETGYRYWDTHKFGDLGVYAGIKPYVVAGNVTANVPTGVDGVGNPTFTNKNMAVQSALTPYVRALYTNMIQKDIMYRASAMAAANGQYRVMHELRFFLD